MKLLLALLLTCLPVDPDVIDLVTRVRDVLDAWLEEHQPPPIVYAFPGAEGAGMYATGGRGGRVIHVENLLDAIPAPPGSFRAALLETGPRIVVFDVGGTIDLVEGKWGSMLRFGDGDITVFGQTAPGGITIQGSPWWIDGESNLVFINLRVLGVHNFLGTSDVMDCVSAQNVTGMIWHHCTFAGPADEVFQTLAGDRITTQWCIFGESALKGQARACHTKGDHNFGWLATARTEDCQLSIHHCLIAHQRRRSPRMVCHENGMVFDVRNNVIYNWGEIGLAALVNKATCDPNKVYVNFLGNSILSGPTTGTDHVHMIQLAEGKGLVSPNIYLPNRVVVEGADPIKVHLNDRYVSLDPTVGPEPWHWPGRWVIYGEGRYLVAPVIAAPVTTHTAAESLELVLDRAGAWPRTALERRTVREVRERSGAHGLRGPYERTVTTEGPCSAKYDKDRDGIPDAWEKQHGGDLDPNGIIPAGVGLADGRHTGYTWIEACWNEKLRRLVGKHGQTWQITTRVEPAGSGVINCDHARPPCGNLPSEKGHIPFGDATYNDGSKAVMDAVAFDGYVFDRWTVNGQRTISAEHFEFTIHGDTEILAHFKRGE